MHRLRTRLILAFLAATTLPLAATVWITTSLLNQSLGYATTGELDRLSRTRPELIVGPVVDGHADDRAVEEAAGLESIERVKGHHPRQVSGDTEDDEDVGGLGFGVSRRGRCCLLWRDGAGSVCHVQPPESVVRH